tara:strand:- start:763 stop:969 length:207 start_codon:yes stop_codon:yes gene_type:complete
MTDFQSVARGSIPRWRILKRQGHPALPDPSRKAAPLTVFEVTFFKKLQKLLLTKIFFYININSNTYIK